MLLLDPVRVHDSFIESIVKHRRRHIDSGGSMVVLPEELERLQFTMDLVRRLEADSWRSPNCLVAAKERLLVDLRASQSQRYHLPDEEVSHLLDSDMRREPTHLCSFGNFSSLGIYNLSPYRVVVVVCTEPEQLDKKYFQTRLHNLIMSRYTVLVTSNLVPKEIPPLFSQTLPVWQCL